MLDRSVSVKRTKSNSIHRTNRKKRTDNKKMRRNLNWKKPQLNVKTTLTARFSVFFFAIYTLFFSFAFPCGSRSHSLFFYNSLLILFALFIQSFLLFFSLLARSLFITFEHILVLFLYINYFFISNSWALPHFYAISFFNNRDFFFLLLFFIFCTAMR